MSGSAKPPAEGVIVPDRDPIYGYQSGDIPTIESLPIHDRDRDHYGEMTDLDVAIVDDVGPIGAGSTLRDALVWLEGVVTAAEG